jgi:hypothetical protein
MKLKLAALIGGCLSLLFNGYAQWLFRQAPKLFN